MAKIVNPPAVLEARSGDVDVPPHWLVRLTPFAQLKAAPSLDKYPGACKLRFFRAGEDLCVHGDPGWSAFCFVPAADIRALRDQAAKTLQDGPAQRATTAALVAKIKADRVALSEQIGQKDLPEKDKKDLEKKMGSSERELEKQEAALALLDEELAKLPEVVSRVEAWLEGERHKAESAPERRRQAAIALPDLLERARRRGEGNGALLEEVPGAAAPRQRQLADLLEPAEPELASCIHEVAGGGDGVERVALARLPRLRVQAPPRPPWFERVRRWMAGQVPKAEAHPTVIPGEGPRDLDYFSRLSSLYDGEVIGEISCWNRTPRSATVTMVRDGFAIEMMRHILDMMNKDAAYQAKAEAVQRQRLLNSALREIPLFAGLPEAELAWIAQRMEFLTLEPGSLICDEHEESDGLYVVGNGIIKVVTGVSWLFPASAEVDAAALRQELAAPEGRFAGARALVAGLMADAGDENVVQALNRIVVDPRWREAAALRPVLEAEKLVFRVWRMLASPDFASARGLRRCNRLLLQALDPQTYPALKTGVLEPELDDAFRLTEFTTDWKKLCARVVADDKQPDDPARTVWDRLPAAVQERLRHGKTGELTSADKEAFVVGLNWVLVGELLLLTPAGSVAQTNANLAAQLLAMVAEGQLWSDFDAKRWGRCLNRLALEALCPKNLSGLPRPSGMPNILRYCSRNQVLGEIGLIARHPRTATLATYNHPKNDPKREVGQVQLFRVSKDLFDEMLQRNPTIRRQLLALAVERQGHRVKELQKTGPAAAVDRSLLQSPRGEALGLVEGQRLMLIDLDRCTRCDECVRACVNTHDDGRSRLFLVGQRHAQYLVPATCRSCLDPVCMIGCPVNSIQLGDSKEIVIRDWCIGCSKCADQCPYGSIQMHDVGMVPAAAHGWRYFPAPAGEAWTAADFDDRKWPTGATPFVDDVNLVEALRKLPGAVGRCALAFRRPFHVAAAELRQNASFQVMLTAPDERARLWLNGRELTTEEKQRQGKRKYVLDPAQNIIQAGDNVLAALVPRPAEATGQTLFGLRLDAERDADNPAVEIKLVTSRAVVCDLCGNLPTGPACVTACPHDAAMRINATVV